MQQTTRSVVFVFFVTIICGVVSSFAIGTDGGKNNIYTESSSTPSSRSNHLFRRAPSLAAQPVSTFDKQPKSRVRKFLSHFNPSPGIKDGRWKGGESKAKFSSRLLFSYVAPLLELASNRTLTETDAFGVSEQLQMESSVDSLAQTYERFQRQSQVKILEEKEKRQNGSKTVVEKSQSLVLLKALFANQKQLLLLTGILRFVNTVIQAFPSILVSRLLKCIEAGEAYPAKRAINTAFMLVSILCIKMITENQFFHNVVKMSTQTRGAVEGLIFDKSLRLPGGGSGVLSKRKYNQEEKALGTGGVLNLMQSDASIIESAAMQIHTTWDGIFQITIYTSLLFHYLGRSVIWGIAVLLGVIPLNSMTLRLLDRLTQQENEAKDARTKRTTESIKNMKLLKVQGWENQFAEDIRGHRKNQLDRYKTRGVVRAVNTAISNCVPSLVLVVTLTAYAKAGKPIVASTIFTAISLFNQLRFPLFFFPMLVDSLANGKNSIRRISSYLTSEEVTPYVEKLEPTNGGSIEVKNGNFLWPTSDVTDGRVATPDSPALCNVNLKVNPGELVAVVGPVGSGKSALLQGLLGELAPVPRMVVDSTATPSHTNGGEMIDKPSVKSHGNIAYCSQEAWIPKGTLRDAILFGRPYNERNYLDALYDAGLDRDITNGVFSHDTDVGEGGSSLSGGQRARVALARALYGGEDTKVFLLDDCLAALDASVGSLVFERVKKRVQRTKAATVLVTNDPSLPRRCDRVVLMGPTDSSTSSSTCSTIVDFGTYDELLARGHKLESFSASSDEEVELDQPEHAGHIRMVNATDLSFHSDPDRPELDLHEGIDVRVDRAIKMESKGNIPEKETFVNNDGASNEPSARSTKLISADDQMTTEAVPVSTYVDYLKAVRSPKLIAAMFLAFIAANGAAFFQQFTVSKWTELARGDTISAALGGQYLQALVYSTGAVSVFLWFRSYFTMLVGLRASDFYHNRMLASVFKAPMSFFDATPSGQLLSRFGKEIETIDKALPDSYASVLYCALQITSSVLALAGAITPTMLVPIMLAGSLYYKTMMRFRSAARDMKRSETKTRSPIYTHFSEALRGTSTIRSIPGASKTWSTNHRRLSDKNISVFSTVKALDRWLSTRLEGLGNFMVLTTAITCVHLSRAGRLLPGKAGWGLTQALSITGLMAWAVRNLTMLESNMMAVIRISELTDIDSKKGKDSSARERQSMPKEYSEAGEAFKAQLHGDIALNVSMAPLNEVALTADGWPWKGGVRFRNVSMRYNPSSPLVLKDMSLSVPAGSTLGVVGRTGSGKSSLLLTLFRIVEIEHGGSIEIDGVDIRGISLKTLRENLAIIPQDPVLFAGTVASNLDTTGKTSAQEMWSALEAASPALSDQFRKSGGLETIIKEGGSNLSQGQRQLICLARALVRRSKILVMDEATSSVDSYTDFQVQNTIRKQFVEKGVTVITVAHRLDTVMGYDKIAVLGDGNLLEYGVPEDLVKIPNGELKRLVDADKRNKQMGAIRSAGSTVA